MRPTVDLSRFISSSTGNVFAIRNLPEEVIAVLFAYYSRSPRDLRSTLASMLAEEAPIDLFDPAIAIEADDMILRRDDGTGIISDLAMKPWRVGFYKKDASEDDKRRLIAELRSWSEEDDQYAKTKARAKAFHEKYTVGYGHASVAEHAVIHLGMENVSIVASKAIEDARLASFTEKSTRYVTFEKGNYHVPATLRGSWMEDVFRSSCERLIEAYLTLLPLVKERVADQLAKEGGKVTDAAVHATALDAVRGLLPAATNTNVGLTANARTMANLITKMASSQIQEARELADQMRVAAESVCPTLMRHTDKSAFREDFDAALFEAAPMKPDVGTVTEPVFILWHDMDPVKRILCAALMGIDTEHIPNVPRSLESVLYLSHDAGVEVLRKVMERRGSHDAAPRCFEASNIMASVTIDYGAYRDLQRHRICSPYPSILGCGIGYEVPALLTRTEEVIYRGAMEGAANAYRQIITGLRQETLVNVMGMMNDEERRFASMKAQISFMHTAQYAVPLGYKTRFMWGMNLRELFHVIELRSGRQGHPSYRRVAQALYRSAVKAMPWLDGLIRVDMSDYATTRPT